MTGWNLPPGVTDRIIDEAFGHRLARAQRPRQRHPRAFGQGRNAPEASRSHHVEEIAEWEDELREPDPDDERDARADYEYERNR